MKKLFPFLVVFMYYTGVMAQATLVYTDNDAVFRDAFDLFYKQKYTSA